MFISFILRTPNMSSRTPGDTRTPGWTRLLYGTSSVKVCSQITYQRILSSVYCGVTCTALLGTPHRLCCVWKIHSRHHFHLKSRIGNISSGFIIRSCTQAGYERMTSNSGRWQWSLGRSLFNLDNNITSVKEQIDMAMSERGKYGHFEKKKS